MPEVICTTVYRFPELSDAARAKARSWYRELWPHVDWGDAVYEDFERICDTLGIRLKTTPVRLMGGGTGQRPASGSPASGVRAMGPALRAISAIPRARRRASGAMRSSTGRCTGSRTSCRLPSGGTSTSSPPRLAAVGVLPRGPNTTTSLRTRLSRRGSPRMRIPSPRLDSASVRAASARPFLLRQVTLPIYLS